MGIGGTLIILFLSKYFLKLLLNSYDKVQFNVIQSSGTLGNFMDSFFAH